MSKPNRYRTDKDDDRETEPSRKGHHGLALLILILLAGVVVWFWLARDPEAREEFSNRMASLRESAINLAADLMSRTTTPPSPPDVGAVAGNSLPGAPPKYRSPIETPAELDEALAEQRPVQPGGAEVRGPVAPGEQVPPDAGRKDDQVVRIAFIDDLASWLVSHYVPAATPGRSGRLSASLQGANLRYGMGMTGLAWIGDDLPAGRTAALNHLFTPGMLDAIYRLYVDRFMEAVNRSAATPLPSGEALSPAQRSEFFKLYARQFRGVAGALQALASMPDFNRQMENLSAAAQRVVDTNAQYSELTFAADEARSNGELTRYSTLRQQMAAKGQQYQQAVIAREQAKSAFVQALKRTPELITLILSIGIFLSLAATVFAAGQPRRYKENSTVKGTISQSFYQVNAKTDVTVKRITVTGTLYEKGTFGTWQKVSSCSNTSASSSCSASSNYNTKPGRSYRLECSATFTYSNGQSETITSTASH